MALLCIYPSWLECVPDVIPHLLIRHLPTQLLLQGSQPHQHLLWQEETNSGLLDVSSLHLHKCGNIKGNYSGGMYVKLFCRFAHVRSSQPAVRWNTWERTNACEKNNVWAWWQQILPREGNKNKINNKTKWNASCFPHCAMKVKKMKKKNIWYYGKNRKMTGWIKSGSSKYKYCQWFE